MCFCRLNSKRLWWRQWWYSSISSGSGSGCVCRVTTVSCQLATSARVVKFVLIHCVFYIFFSLYFIIQYNNYSGIDWFFENNNASIWVSFWNKIILFHWYELFVLLLILKILNFIGKMGNQYIGMMSDCLEYC